MPQHATPLERVPAVLAKRFHSKWSNDDATNCWVWRGSQSNGYGEITITVEGEAKKRLRAHRVGYELYRGEIPEGMQLDHRVCRRKECVNPWHLALCTLIENTLQPDGWGRVSSVKRKARTHCKRGHEWTPENTGIQGDGWRLCKACDNLRGTMKYNKSRLSAVVFI